MKKKYILGILLVCLFLNCSLKVKAIEGSNLVLHDWDFSSIVVADGNLYMWGSNSDGQIGNVRKFQSLYFKRWILE